MVGSLVNCSPLRFEPVIPQNPYRSMFKLHRMNFWSVIAAVKRMAY